MFMILIGGALEMNAFLIIGIVCGFLPFQVYGSCLFNSIEIANKTLWKPDPCSVCSCQSPVTVCQQIQCSVQNCDFASGEHMRIPPNKCCPECSKGGQSCSYDDQVISHNTKWHPKPCQTCVCVNSIVTCTLDSCPQLICPDGSLVQKLPDQCCPQCIAVGHTCLHEEVEHLDGSQWDVMPCVKCRCRNGHVTCYSEECPPTECPLGLVEYPGPGECCPRCRKQECVVEGMRYADHEQWQESPCRTCMCRAGQVNCSTRRCEAVSCGDEEQETIPSGECCPRCVGIKAVCVHGGEIHYSGDAWNTSRCEYCQCIEGSTNCYTAVCDRVVCTKGQVQKIFPGSCCPVCIPVPVCIDGAQTYQNGSSWMPTPCQIFECHMGDIICYAKPCLVCAKNTANSDAADCCHDCYSDHIDPGGKVASDSPLANMTIHLVKNDVLYVTQGESSIISSDTALSLDADEFITIRILSGPKYGKIQNANHDIKSFRAMDLKLGQLKYVHGGDKTKTDVIVFQAHDGWQTLTIPFMIQIEPKESKTPVLVNNNALNVDIGQRKKILPADLWGRSKTKPDAELVMTLTPYRNNPLHGQILMIARKPRGQTIRGWKDEGDGTMSAPMPRFRQSNIQEGHIWYQHNGGQDKEDSFTFEISDNYDPPNVLRDQTFSIIIDNKPQRDAAPSIPTLAPGINLAMTVLENQLVPITNSDLAFMDHDTTDEELRYNIVEPLGRDEGTIEHIDTPFTAVYRFSQDDINKNKIIYRPPQREIGPVQKKVSFKFIVIDGETGESLPEQTFTITIEPVDNRPPVPVNLAPVLKVPQRSTVPITGALKVSDPDTSVDRIMFSLQVPPSHGFLLKLIDGMQAELRKDDAFTYEEVLKDAFFYEHSSKKGVDQDSFTVVITDGQHNVPLTVTVEVLRVDEAAPFILPEAAMSVTLPEGGFAVIGREHMAFGDADAPDTQIQVRLGTSPVHGRLSYRDRLTFLEAGDVFTQANINSGYLRYEAEQEIGSQTLTDILYLNVTDSASNVLPNQVFSVVVTPLNNQPPTVTTGDTLTVDEAGKRQLTISDISVTDVDTSRDQLLVVVNTVPTFGVIINTKRAPGSQDLQSKVVTTFTIRDLLEGCIYYFQDNHLNKEPVEDGFLFYVTDGANQSPLQRFNITIQLTNDEPPMLITEEINCEEGQWTLVTNASIFVSDIDTPASELFLLIEYAPKHGKLRRRNIMNSPFSGYILEQGTRFSYEDIVNELIVYTHDGEEVMMDGMTLTATDGRHKDTKKVLILIGLVDDETPRVNVNRGLQVRMYSTTTLRPRELTATDVDSDDTKLTFTITAVPMIGKLMKLRRNMQWEEVRVGDVIKQPEIEEGHLRYIHERKDTAGMTLFKFSVADTDNNILIDQSFIITILEDKVPPKILANLPLTLKEGNKELISTEFLSATDIDSEPSKLLYIVDTPPTYGHLELVDRPGVPLSEFTQGDLAASTVFYVHTSELEEFMDTFIFSVTDGTNSITQSFMINITPVDDSIPVVTVKGLKVQEGIRRTITEFDLKAIDLDTPDQRVLFTVVEAPVHGRLELLSGSTYTPGNQFTMENVFNGLLSYYHDGTESTVDSFTFIVSDRVHQQFMVSGKNGFYVISEPLQFPIDITPLDDGTPIIVTNIGVGYLTYNDGRPSNTIRRSELEAADIDTADHDLVFEVTTEPLYGQLENVTNPGVPVSEFTQADINKGYIQYVLTNDTYATQDCFVFDLMDTKPNTLSGITFYIRWSLVNFQFPSVNVSEVQRLVQVPVIRIGNLKQYSVVTCRTKMGKARTGGQQPGQNDYVHYEGQIQFDEWQDMKICSIQVNDDVIFEEPENFFIELIQPVYTLIAQPQKVEINIHDFEDEPEIQFKDPVYFTNETDRFFRAAVQRVGDISAVVSAICFTNSSTAKGSSDTGLESGSDYQTRPNTGYSRIIFPRGVTESHCEIRIIDDSLYEGNEEFTIHLTDPSIMSAIGPRHSATIVIQGPNDQSFISVSQDEYYVTEDMGVVEFPVLRAGSDLSHESTVWCSTSELKPLSATPGQDFIPTSHQIVFVPGQVEAACPVTILDDDASTRLEYNETFSIYISAPSHSVLVEPTNALVTIGDEELDIPVIQFEIAEYKVAETAKKLEVSVVRTGDLSYEISAICYTQQNTAQVMMDYDERLNLDSSRIKFLPGERSKICTVGIVDDHVYEPEEVFHLKLGSPLGAQSYPVLIGELDTVVITITNREDAPTISFTKPLYMVREPEGGDQVTTVVVEIVRGGDVNQSCLVRTSTRDGSAVSGLDYSASSKILVFVPGETSKEFFVDVLHNAMAEWHETFMIVLEELVDAKFGDLSMTTITIIDQEVSGGVILPAPPVVVSLIDYDDVKAGTEKEPTPGYPLVCVSPCDSHHPAFLITSPMCLESKINETLIRYEWEVTTQPEITGAYQPFHTLTDNTIFTNVHSRVLDSIYFRPGFSVRCSAQPMDPDGTLGVPLKSNIANVGYSNGICRSPIISGKYHGYQGQSFVTSMRYVGPEDNENPNRMHIKIEIPHQDGMLPLISTLPLHNLRILLTSPIYRRQHVCSNFIDRDIRLTASDYGFLNPDPSNYLPYGPGYNRPYQFDANLRDPTTINLYKHLNLKSCTWTFEAWYHMTELIDVCGGSVISDFEVRENAKTFLTIRVPLFVSYIYASSPIGWASLEHKTDMELSFLYSTVLWRTGMETDGDLSGRLQVLRISANKLGRLVVDFKTETKFRGQFVLFHNAMTGAKSRFLAPPALPLTFDVTLLWSQQSFDGPFQLWRATSDYNMKDYSGIYKIELLPCTVPPTQVYTTSTEVNLHCTPHALQEFSVPISYQQTLRPVPVTYSLDTEFQLHNNEKIFLMNPKSKTLALEEMDYSGKFAEGQTVFGRVLWHPNQDLEKAYKLRIEKVFLCSGREGFVPTYDPSGEIYKEGPQYGCIQPSSNLRYRFLIIDRGDPHVADISFANVQFDAKLVFQIPEFSIVEEMPGVDGFTFKADPLYKVESGNQWFIQVIYQIGSAERLNRYQRSLDRSKRASDDPGGRGGLLRNGTNIKMIRLTSDETRTFRDNQIPQSGNWGVYVAIILILVVLGIGSGGLVFFIKKKRRLRRFNVETKVVNNDLSLGRAGKFSNVDVYASLKKDIRTKTINYSSLSLQNIAQKVNDKGLRSLTCSREDYLDEDEEDAETVV